MAENITHVQAGEAFQHAIEGVTNSNPLGEIVVKVMRIYPIDPEIAGIIVDAANSFVQVLDRQDSDMSLIGEGQ